MKRSSRCSVSNYHLHSTSIRLAAEKRGSCRGADARCIVQRGGAALLRPGWALPVDIVSLLVGLVAASFLTWRGR